MYTQNINLFAALVGSSYRTEFPNLRGKEGRAVITKYLFYHYTFYICIDKDATKQLLCRSLVKYVYKRKSDIFFNRRGREIFENLKGRITEEVGKHCFTIYYT